MKNLANCKPSEFIKQTNRIRKSIEKWIDVTHLMEIRSRVPEFKTIPLGADEETRQSIGLENKKLRNEQAKANISAMLDEMLENHPDETLEVLALCCFVEPDKVDDYSVAEYLNAFNELVSNEAVIGFFSLLVRVGQTNS